MSELLLAHCTRRVNLVAKDKEWNLGELFDGKECVKLCLRLRKPLKVSTVDKEDDSVNLREVVTPESASWCFTVNAVIVEIVQEYAPCW